MRRRNGVVLCAIFAAGVIIALAAGVLASNADTFVTDVPWSSAVIASRQVTTITVRADVRGMDDDFACGRRVKSLVTETRSSVAIDVQVFNHPLPPATACGGVGLAFIPAVIHLRAPLGDRVLTDRVTDRMHPVLVVDQEPSVTGVATPFVRRATGWDESTGLIGEWWRWQKHSQAQQLDLDLGPTRAAAKYGPSPLGATHPIVGAVTATAWQERGGDTITSTVTWSPRVGQTYRLTMIDQTREPIGLSAVVALARSVRVAVRFP